MDYPKSVPSVGLVNGKFVDENPVNGSPGSLIPAVWGNAVTEELLNVVQAGGLQPSETARDQLLTAIRTIIQSSLPVEQVRTTLAAYGITDAYTKAEIEEKLKNTSALPVGVMVPFPKGTVPPGYLEVDGSVQSAATYPELYAYLGTTFNTGSEPAGFFRLPESRGEFLRGWDHGRGVDSGRLIGSWQSDEFKKHRHPQYEYDSGNNVPIPDGSYAADLNAGVAVGYERTALIGYAGGSETRGRNIAVMWCIKAWNAPTNQGNIDVAALAAQVQNVQKVAIAGSHKGLKASASGVNSMVSISADQLVVGNEVSFKTLGAFTITVNTAVTGLNGLDIGALIASTWYSLWVIWNGSEYAGLISLSATAPQLPAGYTHKARVGWIQTDATNKYPLGFVQLGRKVRYRVATGSNVPALRQMASGAQGAPTTPTWVAVSTAQFVPPTASMIAVSLYAVGASVQAIFAPNQSYGAVSNAANLPAININSGTSNSNANNYFSEVILESSNVFYASNASISSLSVIGWEDSL
ncbi:phage tail protein [Pseudomonas gingeri]|uniref:phage tail protein n=1 Tax=Pseudomonas gingeri TaxID=117681 RepID=UPI0015A3DB96|nr:tail fiber protein [Pseudomonas gingeri]NWA16399.1 tail fiber protein [Pseudomonas gingeri]NWA54717.1 tail fiber protein [Pseudomonas gingeri]NWA99106.1 tail fiber protein [Pseudomonas gingeri]NWB05626.1 tail fiber protein [Pseudomonas gingeri]